MLVVACPAPEEPPAPPNLFEGLEFDENGHIRNPESPATTERSAETPSEPAEAEARSGDFRDDRDASRLQRTHWWQATDGAAFRSIRFHDSAVTFRTADGQDLLFAADFSATSDACGGYPLCVLTVGNDQAPIPFFFGLQDGLLFLAQCISAVGQPAEAWEEEFVQARRQHEGMVFHDRAPSLCWNPASVPFASRPFWFTEADAARSDAQGAERVEPR